MIPMAEEISAAGDFGGEAIGHLDALYRGALRLSRDPDKAQDPVQDTYARALRYQHSHQAGTTLKAWTFPRMRTLSRDLSPTATRATVRTRAVGRATPTRASPLPRAHGGGKPRRRFL